MKKYCLLILCSIMLFSCNKNKKPIFDADFKSVCDYLKDSSNTFNELTTIEENGEYLFYLSENKELKINMYYRSFKEQYRYVFVINFDYNNIVLKDVRLVCALINGKDSIIAQVGFQNDKKIISSLEDKQSSTYKGIQLFLSPFFISENNRSIVRFYFEHDKNIGKSYQIDLTKVKEKM